ncbi:hypothetical protein EI77_01326 [Prosthecobacter fusiformis]|uniref:Uncharacterized protein n=1 Tax=Prosthecobacter fusiformis TaxID=48464 RepID=A0A4R7S3A3_9BACT|nr:hypothetical protein [Prosthecobacter fusiformis]TDU72860.1 hypothetical protein EI77_01326 [Prosthecobacter fusiformis]
MNDLAQRLRALAGSLEKHAPNLDSAAFVKKAVTFSKALTGFESATAEALSGLAPGLHELEKLLASPDKKALKEPVMKKLFQEVLQTKPPADAKLPAQHKLFLKLVKENGAGELALAAVRSAVSKAQLPVEPPPKDKESLQAELLRLGRLDEGGFADELDVRYKKLTDLKSLAKANALPVPKAVEKAWLVRELRRISLRVASHQLT